MNPPPFRLEKGYLFVWIQVGRFHENQSDLCNWKWSLSNVSSIVVNGSSIVVILDLASWREKKKPRSRVLRRMSRVVSESALSRIIVGAWNSSLFLSSSFPIPLSTTGKQWALEKPVPYRLLQHTLMATLRSYTRAMEGTAMHTHTHVVQKKRGISCLFLQWNHNRWQRLACSCVQRQRHYGWTHSDNRAHRSRHYAYLQRTYGW